MSDLKKQLGILAGLIVLLAIVFVIFGLWSPDTTKPGSTSKLPPQVAPSIAVQQQLAQSNGFQYLVSYSDQGFSPISLTVPKGSTVRFLNDSHGQLWVASVAQGSQPQYPGSSSCGGSSFDTCQILQTGDFWEFTFTQTGTWSFRNNANTSMAGSITVN